MLYLASSETRDLIARGSSLMLQGPKNNMPFKRKKPLAEPEGALLPVAAMRRKRRWRRGGGSVGGRNTYIMHANCKDWM